MIWFLLAAQIALVPGTAGTYTDGTYYWAGNPACVGPGYNWTLQQSSPARGGADKGCVHTGDFTLHCTTGPNDTPPNSAIDVTTVLCPARGSALNQPRLPDNWNSYCVEWWDTLGPSIGACQYATAALVNPTPPVTNPNAPSNVQVTLK